MVSRSVTAVLRCLTKSPRTQLSIRPSSPPPRPPSTLPLAVDRTWLCNHAHSSLERERERERERDIEREIEREGEREGKPLGHVLLHKHD